MSLILTAIVVLALYGGLTFVASGLLTIDELAASEAPIALMASKLPVIGPYRRCCRSIESLDFIESEYGVCGIDDSCMIGDYEFVSFVRGGEYGKGGFNDREYSDLCGRKVFVGENGGICFGGINGKRILDGGWYKTNRKCNL